VAREPRFTDLTAAEEAAYRRGAARELREEAAVAVEPADLIPIAHWVTPEIEPRRYDTRFFLTELPPGQEARHDEGETTELAWCTPTEAIERSRRGEMMLPPPTWTTLRQLEHHSTLGAVLDWARTTRVVRIQPAVAMDGAARVLTLPGDPSFPTIEGWVVPQETRFVLEEGRWLPIRR
jgi:ADP-ribose pyrophosphatase YjhB (NUDIX family)